MESHRLFLMITGGCRVNMCSHVTALPSHIEACYPHTLLCIPLQVEEMFPCTCMWLGISGVNSSWLLNSALFTNPNLLYFSLTWLSSSLVLCSSASRLSMQTTVCSKFWWRSAFSSWRALNAEGGREKDVTFLTPYWYCYIEHKHMVGIKSMRPSLMYLHFRDLLIMHGVMISTKEEDYGSSEINCGLMRGLLGLG